MANMKAFNDDELVREAFRSATSEIVTRIASNEYYQILSRGRGSVEALMRWLLRDIDVKVSYATLGFPDKLILLVLAILHELPEMERQSWLDRLFLSVGVGANLEEMHVWEQDIEWLLLHPFVGVINEVPLQSARQAVKEVARLILADSHDYDEWMKARWAVNQSKRELFADAEVKGELTSPMGSEVPAIAAIYVALAITNLGAGVDAGIDLRTHILFIVSTASSSVPIKQQADALIALVRGGTP